MVEVPHFCSLRPKTGQLSSQASLIPLLQGELLGMQISQGSGLLPESCVFLIGVQPERLREGRGCPCTLPHSQEIPVHPLVPQSGADISNTDCLMASLLGWPGHI